MFGSKNTQAMQGVTTLIARNTRVEGTIKYSGELDIEGVIAGDIFAEHGKKSVVKILEHGRVEGEVHAPDVIINGHVTGDVYAAGQLYLAAKAVVEGTVYYNTIEMEKGAQINGSLVHLDEKTANPAISQKDNKNVDKTAVTAGAKSVQADLKTANS